MFFANNSKTITDRENLTQGKNDQHDKIYLLCEFQKNPLNRYRVIALECQFLAIFAVFGCYFENYRSQMRNVNCKDDKYDKIYLR